MSVRVTQAHAHRGARALRVACVMPLNIQKIPFHRVIESVVMSFSCWYGACRRRRGILLPIGLFFVFFSLLP
jgi:hypothetical protein